MYGYVLYIIYFHNCTQVQQKFRLMSNNSNKGAITNKQNWPQSFLSQNKAAWSPWEPFLSSLHLARKLLFLPARQICRASSRLEHAIRWPCSKVWGSTSVYYLALPIWFLASGTTCWIRYFSMLKSFVVEQKSVRNLNAAWGLRIMMCICVLCLWCNIYVQSHHIIICEVSDQRTSSTHSRKGLAPERPGGLHESEVFPLAHFAISNFLSLFLANAMSVESQHCLCLLRRSWNTRFTPEKKVPTKTLD